LLTELAADNGYHCKLVFDRISALFFYFPMMKKSAMVSSLNKETHNFQRGACFGRE
jgi:hypothetical protein